MAPIKLLQAYLGYKEFSFHGVFADKDYLLLLAKLDNNILRAASGRDMILSFGHLKVDSFNLM
ncbi:hypothetical protein NC651_014782 [Populus alba x Populus x berolinensis]|nr:hypothetical protein NC651_014782 [Populus alba x Populus x berolinensis]